MTAFSTIYFSPIVASFASMATIVCFFVLVYDKLITVSQQEKIDLVFNIVFKWISKINIHALTKKTVMNLEKWLQHKTGIPKKYKITDPHFYQEKNILLGMLIAFIPPLIMELRGFDYYLWGPCSFISIYFSPHLFKKSNTEVFFYKKPFRKFIAFSVYNYMFYAIPAVIGWLILKNTNILVGFESMRTNSILYCICVILIAFEFANIRILIRKLAYAKKSTLVIVKYVMSCVFCISIAVLLSFSYMSFAKNFYNTISEIIAFNDSWLYYLIISSIVFTFPIFIGILIIILLLALKYIISPILKILNIILKFIIKRKMYILLLAIASTVLITNILYYLGKTKT